MCKRKKDMSLEHPRLFHRYRKDNFIILNNQTNSLMSSEGKVIDTDKDISEELNMKFQKYVLLSKIRSSIAIGQGGKGTLENTEANWLKVRRRKTHGPGGILLYLKRSRGPLNKVSLSEDCGPRRWKRGSVVPLQNECDREVSIELQDCMAMEHGLQNTQENKQEVDRGFHEWQKLLKWKTTRIHKDMILRNEYVRFL